VADDEAVVEDIIDLALAFRRRLAYLKPLAAGQQPTREGLVDVPQVEAGDDHLQ
jgi:hypothetical protein